MHEHKFQLEGDTWACFGWKTETDEYCGVRAPACFTPKPEACTESGLMDLFIAEHFVVVNC